MAYAIAFVAFVILALFLVQAVGPLLGTVAWLMVYGVFQVCAKWLRRKVDPA